MDGNGNSEGAPSGVKSSDKSPDNEVPLAESPIRPRQQGNAGQNPAPRLQDRPVSDAPPARPAARILIPQRSAAQSNPAAARDTVGASANDARSKEIPERNLGSAVRGRPSANAAQTERDQVPSSPSRGAKDQAIPSASVTQSHGMELDRSISENGLLKRFLRRVSPQGLARDSTMPAMRHAVAEPLQLLIAARHALQRKFRRRFGLFCGLPTLAVFCYAAFVASPRYDSVFEITYQTYQPQTSLNSGLIQNFLGANMGNTVDLSAIIYEYIQSSALLNKLDAELHLRQYYSSSRVDYLSRMDPDANFRTFLMYYHWYVSVAEGQGGYLTVTVQGFDPVFTDKLSKALIKATDDMVNNLTARAREREVGYAKSQVAQAEARYRKARFALTQFQNEHSDLNPQNSAGQLGGIIGALEGQLATQRAYLTSVKSLGPQSPQVKVVQTNIASLEQQLRDEQKRLATHVDANGATPYSLLLNQYAGLQLEEEFAKVAYQAAQQNLALAAANAAAQQNYLIDFAPPIVPDDVGIYFVIECTLTTFVISVVLFGILSLMSGAMRDQMAA